MTCAPPTGRPDRSLFGAADGVKQSGVKELKDHQLAGTPGMASVRSYLAQGWQTLVF